MFEVLLQHPFYYRLGLYFLAVVVFVVWAKWVVLSAKAGAARFIRALPLFILTVFVSHLFNFKDPDERSFATYVSLQFNGLVPFRIFSLCINRGQPVKAQTSGLLAFAISFLLPLSVAFNEKKLDLKKKTDSDDKKERLHEPFDDVSFSVVTCSGMHRVKEIFKALLICAIKVPLIVALAYIWRHWNQFLFLKLETQVWWFFCFFSVLENINEVISLAAFGIKLSPSFDKPYLAASVSDFWSKRWNRVIHVLLSETIYEPILQNRLVTDRQYYSKRGIHIVRRMIGALCVFSVSGLAHVWMLTMIVDVKTFPYLYLSFFVANGVAFIIEKFLKQCISCSDVLSSFISRLPKSFFMILTHVVLVTLGHFFFFPDLISTGYLNDAMDGCLKILG